VAVNRTCSSRSRSRQTKGHGMASGVAGHQRVDDPRVQKATVQDIAQDHARHPMSTTSVQEVFMTGPTRGTGDG
jgi:hypothetical protein